MARSLKAPPPSTRTPRVPLTPSGCGITCRRKAPCLGESAQPGHMPQDTDAWRHPVHTMKSRYSTKTAERRQAGASTGEDLSVWRKGWKDPVKAQWEHTAVARWRCEQPKTLSLKRPNPLLRAGDGARNRSVPKGRRRNTVGVQQRNLCHICVFLVKSIVMGPMPGASPGTLKRGVPAGP